MTTTAKGRGKVKPWRAHAWRCENGSRTVSESFDPHNCTVYPDGCDPTPAAAKRLIQMALDWGDMKAGNAMLLNAIGTYRKSTAAKKTKKGVKP